jgi:hypothetical protein
VHVASTYVGSREESDHFGSYVRSLSQFPCISAHEKSVIRRSLPRAKALRGKTASFGGISGTYAVQEPRRRSGHVD